MDTSGHLLGSCICWPFLKLDTSRHLYLSRITDLLYICSVQFQISFSSISLNCFVSFHLPNISFSLQTLSSRIFRPRSSLSSLGKGPNPSFSCISCIWPNFLGFFENFGVFQNWWSYCEIFRMGFVFLILKHHALHLICIIIMFHAFLDVCLLCCKHVCW